MEDNTPDQNHNSSRGSERSEPVRSRWTPKPEQILILESIFNSGMVNPPKDETVRIRKLLEKFGSVGDANVFYWFQNRRSRSRRRQRQLQAGLINDQRIPIQGGGGSSSGGGGGAIQYAHLQNNACFAPPPPPPCLVGSSSSSSYSSSSSSLSCGGIGGVGIGIGTGDDDVVEDLFSSMSNQMGLPDVVDHHHNTSLNQILCLSDQSNLPYQSVYDMDAGFITVFINGVLTEVPRGPIDMKAMFGQNIILVHSSGVPVPVNEYGISLQSLQLGESYFLVSGPT